MKTVAVLQSSYIPWKGYFDIIHDVDLFVFYDDVPYTERDWRNRNRVKTPNGPCWLTIPVGHQKGKLIHEIKLADSQWSRKHWSTIRHSYSRAPYFRKYREFFEHIFLEIQWTSLSELNQFLIKTISKEFLGIAAEFRDAREFCLTSQKFERLFDLLIKIQADLYISGPSAKVYMDEKRLLDAGIQLVYKDYSGYPEYNQPFPPFEHRVSILDLLFNVGPNAPDYIWGWRKRNANSKVKCTIDQPPLVTSNPQMNLSIILKQ